MTDEDSGDEDFVLIDTLPASQLQVSAEIAFEKHNDSGFISPEDLDDDLSLSLLQSSLCTQRHQQLDKYGQRLKKRLHKRGFGSDCNRF